MGKIYEYSELKGVIKVGDRVRAVPGKDGGCYKLRDGNIQPITEVNDNAFSINDCSHSYSKGGFLELLPAEKTWDNLQVGDVIVDTDGNKAKVLDVFTNTFIPSMFSNHREASSVYSFYEAKKLGWTIEGAQPKTTLTRQEIADKFGITVEELEIKG